MSRRVSKPALQYSSLHLSRIEYFSSHIESLRSNLICRKRNIFEFANSDSLNVNQDSLNVNQDFLNVNQDSNIPSSGNCVNNLPSKQAIDMICNRVCSKTANFLNDASGMFSLAQLLCNSSIQLEKLLNDWPMLGSVLRKAITWSNNYAVVGHALVCVVNLFSEGEFVGKRLMEIVPSLIQLIEPNANIIALQDLALWALGNIAANVASRERILKNGVVFALLNLWDAVGPRSQLFSTIIFCLANLVFPGDKKVVAIMIRDKIIDRIVHLVETDIELDDDFFWLISSLAFYRLDYAELSKLNHQFLQRLLVRIVRSSAASNNTRDDLSLQLSSLSLRNSSTGHVFPMIRILSNSVELCPLLNCDLLSFVSFVLASPTSVLLYKEVLYFLSKFFLQSLSKDVALSFVSALVTFALSHRDLPADTLDELLIALYNAVFYFGDEWCYEENFLMLLFWWTKLSFKHTNRTRIAITLVQMLLDSSATPHFLSLCEAHLFPHLVEIVNLDKPEYSNLMQLCICILQKHVPKS